jgi:hypothetical protein
VGISHGEPYPRVQIGERTTGCINNWPSVCVPQLRGAAFLFLVLTSFHMSLSFRGQSSRVQLSPLLSCGSPKAAMSDEPFFPPAAGFPRKMGEVPIGGWRFLPLTPPFSPLFSALMSPMPSPIHLAQARTLVHTYVPCAGRFGPRPKLGAVSDPASVIPLS